VTKRHVTERNVTEIIAPPLRSGWRREQMAEEIEDEAV
jgi:hypothetical protein